jgi:hypothetical protein
VGEKALLRQLQTVFLAVLAAAVVLQVLQRLRQQAAQGFLHKALLVVLETLITQRTETAAAVAVLLLLV